MCHVLMISLNVASGHKVVTDYGWQQWQQWQQQQQYHFDA